MPRSFLSDRGGNFAVITALAMVPLCGAMGMALDLSRGLSARNMLQDRADEAALYVARQGPTAANFALLQYVTESLPSQSHLQDVKVNARWTAVNDYTVTIEGNLQLSLAQVLPGVADRIPVSAEAVARYKDALREYKPPTTTLLDPEAGDYNRIFAYCFDAEKKKDTRTHGRSQEVAIADNGQSVYENPMPKCSLGETMSFRLYNVRGARGNPWQWDDRTTERYDYYTDTEMKPEETYNLNGLAMLETVLCPTLEVCKPKDQGGIIPQGRERLPARAKEACSEGKYMYYGWEDRPPGPDSDEDYDDIRVIVECAVEKVVGEQSVRLVR